MEQIDYIINLLKTNEETARKFNNVETKILSILNFKDFFEVLLTDIINTFQIPYVWLTVVEGTDFAAMIENTESDLVKDHLVFISENEFNQYMNEQTSPVLINSDIKEYGFFLQQNIKDNAKSIALAPISMDGHIIGCLNHGDTSESRFQPGIDTSLLEQLALKISICLSNVTAHEKLKFLAYHDPLTGLLNRRVMESELEREFERTKRYKSPLSVIFSDLDDFKIINDTYGHDIGDKVLTFIADCLSKNSRKTEIVSRFAGDEFVIILPETDYKSAENFVIRAEKLLKTNSFKTGDSEIYISMSFGIASTDTNEVSQSEELLKYADENLYKVKLKKKSVKDK